MYHIFSSNAIIIKIQHFIQMSTQLPELCVAAEKKGKKKQIVADSSVRSTVYRGSCVEATGNLLCDCAY